jgi:hypothetical protein
VHIKKQERTQVTHTQGHGKDTARARQGQDTCKGTARARQGHGKGKIPVGKGLRADIQGKLQFGQRMGIQGTLQFGQLAGIQGKLLFGRRVDRRDRLRLGRWVDSQGKLRLDRWVDIQRRNLRSRRSTTSRTIPHIISHSRIIKQRACDDLGKHRLADLETIQASVGTI